MNERELKQRTKEFFHRCVKLALALPLQFSIALLILLLPLSSHAQPQEASEYEVKAGFVYNFTKFTEWPEGALDGGFNICVLGEDPFGTHLDSITGKAVGNRKVVIKKADSVRDIGGCQVLFISSSEKGRIQEIIEAVRDKNILTVGDTEVFAKNGVIINLFMENKKVRFEINPDAAVRSGLRISPRLLGLARIVREGR